MTASAGRALALLAATLVLGMSTWLSAAAVLPQLRSEWSLAEGTGAWLTISVQLGFVAGALLLSASTVADVVSPQPLMLAGAAGAAVCNLGLLAVSSAAGAIPLRAATGFCLAAVYPPAFKLMATWFRRGRGAALGTLAGGIALGSALPHLVNGFGGAEWTTVIVTTSALTALGGLLALLVPMGPHVFPPARFAPRQAPLVFANRHVRLAILGYVGHMWELYAMWAWFLFFARDGIGLDRNTAALATFAAIGIGGLSCAAAGAAADRVGRAEVAGAALACSAACALVIGFLPAQVALVVGIVWGASVIADSALFSTLVTEHADQAYVGTALGLQLGTGFALSGFTIWLVPALERASGWPLAFGILAIGPLLGLIAMMRLKRVATVAG